MKFLRKLYELLQVFGIDLNITFRSIRGLPYYIRDYFQLRNQRKGGSQDFPIKIPIFCLQDRFSESGSAKGHYFHQDLLVAKRIHQNRPIIHADVGSRIDGFVAHVASFRSIEVFDIRHLDIEIPNIHFMQADLMAQMNSELIGYCDSLSCLHAVEHFGLGRYRDPINEKGHLIGLSNLYKMLKPRGKFYLSLPIGPQRLDFNAHRVFSVGYIMNYLEGKYSVDQFSYVDDKGALHEAVNLTEAGIKENFGCAFGCGIFELTKL